MGQNRGCWPSWLNAARGVFAQVLLIAASASCVRFGIELPPGVDPGGRVSVTDPDSGRDSALQADAGAGDVSNLVLDGSSDLETRPADALAADTLAPDAPAPDTLAPDTLAPDTLAPDTLAPDTLAPDTLAPDTLAPDTLAPDLGPAWALPAWSWRRSLRIAARAPGATHTEFAVLVEIRNDASLRDHARGDGHDIRFVTADGAVLEHETESFDAGTGTLRAWVKLPRLDTRSDTLFFLYYGNTGATSNPSVLTVWSNQYLAVWHLGEQGAGVAGEFRDSSGSGNHARGGGGNSGWTPARVSGKIGHAVGGDGTDDFVSTPLNLAGKSVVTLTGWINVRRVNNIARPGIFGQNDTLEIGFYWRDRLNAWTPNTTTDCPGKGVPSVCSADFALNQWMHLALVYDGANATLYLDGVQKHVATCNSLGGNAASFNLLGRVFDPTGNHLDGMMDEVRVASTARSSAWIAHQHATQSDPASFIVVGEAQSAP